MPIVKPISGHTGCERICSYLQKDGRALAIDTLNMEWRTGEESRFKSWAEEMDFTRIAYGNHLPWKGKPARTFKHYVLSPDPVDGIGIDTMREFAVAWARENFDGYQVAIVYHDDNENGIMHAHVVVNNTHLETGRRLQDPDPRALKRSAQRLAEERGLAFFEDGGETRGQGRTYGRMVGAKETVHYRRAEKELEERGAYSWVADIRARVAIARKVARDGDDFLQALAELGIEVSSASSRGGRNEDWIYSMAGHPTWRVRAENLGTSFGKHSIETQLALRSAPDAQKAQVIREIAARAVELDHLSELEGLAHALEVAERHGIRSLEGYDREIASACNRGDETSAAELAASREFSAAKKLVPKKEPGMGTRHAKRGKAGPPIPGKTAAKARSETSQSRAPHERERGRQRGR